jgi:hypothetical protein
MERRRFIRTVSGGVLGLTGALALKGSDKSFLGEP